MANQQLMLDLKGLEVDAEEREILKHPIVGGLILFSRNYHSPEQLAELIKQIRQCNKDILIAVDQEGGRVQRFKNGFTVLPPMGALGKHYDTDPDNAKKIAKTAGWLMATELAAFGIDFSFAPVLDLDVGVSEVIGNRAFHADPSVIIKLATAFCEGQQMAKMAPIGKHFPGHGSVKADSHKDIPIDHRSKKEIYENDLVPFVALSKVVLGIMPAHVIYSQVDSLPAGFSSHWLQKVLRGELNFSGVIFSDDLKMEGASKVGDFISRATHALTAGCDMILICNDRTNALNVMDRLKQENNVESQQRLTKMRNKPLYQWKELSKVPEWQTAVSVIKKMEEK